MVQNRFQTAAKIGKVSVSTQIFSTNGTIHTFEFWILCGHFVGRIRQGVLWKAIEAGSLEGYRAVAHISHEMLRLFLNVYRAEPLPATIAHGVADAGDMLHRRDASAYNHISGQ